MRRLIVAGVLLAVIFGASFALAERIGRVTADLGYSLQSAELYAKEGSWSKTEEQTKRAKEKWEKESKWLGAVLNHTKMDEVSALFEESLAHIRAEMLPEYLAHNTILISRLSLLYALERPVLSNVF